MSSRSNRRLRRLSAMARLADAGARVIKIERPEGDFARGYDDALPAASSYFVWLNRGKELVVLDLRLETARDPLTGLIAAPRQILAHNLGRAP